MLIRLRSEFAFISLSLLGARLLGARANKSGVLLAGGMREERARRSESFAPDSGKRARDFARINFTVCN